MMLFTRLAGISRPCSATGVTLAVILLVVVSIAPAHAAVRLCRVEVSALASANTEKQAKKAALDAWKQTAAKFGEEYTSWRLASPKFLKCLPATGKAYECLARATPCTIEQAPSRRHLREKRLGI